MSTPFFFFSVVGGVLGRVGAAWYIPTGAAVETRGGVETWPACQPITQAAAPEARADPPPQEGSQEHADGPRRSSPPITDTIPAQAPTDAGSSGRATPRPIDHRHADRMPPQAHRNATQTAPSSGMGELSTAPADAPRTPRNATNNAARGVIETLNSCTHLALRIYPYCT